MSVWTRGWAKFISRLAVQYLTLAKSTGLNLKLHITAQELEAWTATTNLFFILALGRSGSMFLAHLLDQARSAQVYHEPVRADFVAYPAAFHNPDKAADYLLRFRSKDIYLRTRGSAQEVYGEVNSNLRRHAAALGQVFPKATRLHLIRDGRDVVRSMMSRRTFRAWDPVTALIHPHKKDPWAKAWPQMDRFEKACWYWMAENRYLRRVIDRTVHFEKLISDYDYFASELLMPLGLTIQEETWHAAKERPKNVTRQYRIPQWSDWNDRKRGAFERICGEEMRKNGYEID